MSEVTTPFALDEAWMPTSEPTLSRLDMIAQDHFLRKIRVTIELCQLMVAAHHGVNVGYVISAQRTKLAVQLSSMAAYLARVETKRSSFRALGRKFNGRNHATLLHSCQKMEALLPLRPDLQEEIDMYRNVIKRWKPVDRRTLPGQSH
jgi:chromosomal replication initiation ATPase DnaA